MAKYPNVTIDRTKRSFADLQRTLRNAITSEDAPDVVQANNGRTDMGAFVQNGLLQSLDGYAEAYGWTDRFPESVRSLATYSDDGATFGEGSLYGLAAGRRAGRGLLQQGQARPTSASRSRRPPRTSRPRCAAAKDAGELPIQFGNLDGWPGIHDYGFVQNQFVPREDIRNLGFGREGASWTSEPRTCRPPTTLHRLGRVGYFTHGLQRRRLRPGLAGLREGRGRVPGRRHLAAGRPRRRHGRRRRLRPAAGRATTGERAVTGGTGLPVLHHRGVATTPTWRRPTSTSSPATRRCR